VKSTVSPTKGIQLENRRLVANADDRARRSDHRVFNVKR